MDPYANAFELVDSFVRTRTASEALIELGGIDRTFPDIDEKADCSRQRQIKNSI